MKLLVYKLNWFSGPNMVSKKIEILILIKHAKHHNSNSAYALAAALLKDPRVEKVDIASNSIVENDNFFEGNSEKVWIRKVNNKFSYDSSRDNDGWMESLNNVKDYSFIFMRLPPPLNEKFTKKIVSLIGPKKVINNPISALKYGSKSMLPIFSKYCPPMQIIDSFDDLLTFTSSYKAVLKPFNEHGGQGIVKVENGQIEIDGKTESLEDFWQYIQINNKRYIAMKFLEGVGKGDKRIVVANGKVILSVLRKPKQGSWLCNVSQGGHEEKSTLTKKEIKMAEEISEVLLSEGIVLFAIDTLEENGIRYVSEINCTSVGGIAPAEKLYGQEFTTQIANLLVDYMETVNCNK